MLADLGFGSVTLGTVTPDSQQGNPKPRLFRLPQERGLINRFALPNEGADAVVDRLDSMPHPDVPVGVVIDKMNTSDAAQGIADNQEVFEKLYDYADYFVTSFCPNTPDNYEIVRNDEGAEYMADIFEELQDANHEDIPILVRAGRDPRQERLQTIVDVVERYDLDGFMTMTPETDDRWDLKSAHRYETGNLTGRPIERSSTDVVRMLYRMTDLPIVGVGGVDSAESAYQKIRAGASMVALYTGFVYGGPALASQINAGLVQLLEQNGFSSISGAVGAGVAKDDEEVTATV
jgi:dihydroorotate dehydrogenase